MDLLRNKPRIGLAVLLLVALSAGALAQVTANLTGSVTTEGSPLPGVLVTASSPALQGTRTTVTDSNGAYSFPALPPGRYHLSFVLAGLQTVAKTADLALSTTNRVDAEMGIAMVAEAITVTASASAVMETAQVATNITNQMVEELPIGRTVLAAALLAPGVNDNTASGSQLQISGSPGYDNLVMVNGVVITENIRNQALGLVIEDAIQETTVLTGAVSAEYGRFTGGVVNSITKSGGNQFSGSLRDSMTNDDWTKKTPYASEPDHLDDINHLFEVTFGGYILRDRLWFFGAGRDQSFEERRTTRTTDIPFIYSDEEQRLEGKLTGQIGPSHNVVASYLDVTSATKNSRFTSRSYDLASLTDREDPMSLFALHYNGLFGSSFLLEGHYSERTWEVANGSGSKFTDLIQGTLMLNTGDGSARFNSPTFCGVCDVETRDNEGLTLKGTYFFSTPGFGTHNLVGGLESFAYYRSVNNFQSGSNFRVYVEDVVFGPNNEIYPVIGNRPGSNWIRWTPIFDNANENDLATDSAFINDRWDLNDHWSFNIGGRYDKNDAVDGNGRTISDDAAFSPRLTAIFDPRGDGRHRFTGSFNRYVTMVGEGPGTDGETTGNPALIDYLYNGPLINPPGTPTSELLTSAQALQILWDWFHAQGGTENLALLKPGGGKSVPGFDVIFPSTLSSPSVDEIVLGYGIAFGANAFLKLDYVTREWANFYGYRVTPSNPQVTDFLGIDHDLQIVENTDEIVREYDGVQVQGAWRPMIHDQRLNFGLSYTWSELTGNDTQESSSSGTVGNDPLSSFYPEFLGFEQRKPVGYLSGDQRHRFRGWVGYDLPLPEVIGRLNATLLHNFDSGLSYSATGTVDPYRYVDNPGYVLSAAYFPSYYFSERGQFRVDDVHRTDIALNYLLPIFRGVQLFAQADVLNLFDNDAVTDVNSTVYTARSSLCRKADGTRCDYFNPFTETPVEGVHWQKRSNFGQPENQNDYQTPLAYRFSIGLRF